MISLGVLEDVAERLTTIYAKFCNEMELLKKFSISRHIEGVFRDP